MGGRNHEGSPPHSGICPSCCAFLSKKRRVKRRESGGNEQQPREKKEKNQSTWIVRLNELWASSISPNEQAASGNIHIWFSITESVQMCQYCFIRERSFPQPDTSQTGLQSSWMLSAQLPLLATKQLTGVPGIVAQLSTPQAHKTPENLIIGSQEVIQAGSSTPLLPAASRLLVLAYFRSCSSVSPVR